MENLENHGIEVFQFPGLEIKVMEFNCRSWKVVENYSYVWYVNYCRSGSKDKIKCTQIMSENAPKTRMILTLFETGSSVNFRSWKTEKRHGNGHGKSWNLKNS